VKRSTKIRQEATSARENKRPTAEGQKLVDELTTPGEKQQIAQAQKAGKSDAEIQEKVLAQKAREIDAETGKLESETHGPRARNSAIEREIRRLKGVIDIPERAGGSHKQVSAKTKQGESESHHLVAREAYVGRIPLTVDEGPSIYMLEEDHWKTASHSRTTGAAKWRAKQTDLVERGKFQEAFEMGVEEIRIKSQPGGPFADGRYKKGIKQAEEYAKQLDPNKLKPKGGTTTPTTP
jgi:hypothetical protein